MTKSVHSFFPEETKSNNDDIKYLYHYTKLDAVKNILKSKKIRMYKYNLMNDSTEGKLVLNKIRTSGNIEKIESLMLENYYLCSFCRLGNLLSLWRGYGNINIGFDSSLIRNNSRYITDKISTNLDTSGTQFVECEYLVDYDEDFQNISNKIRNIVDNIDFNTVNNIQFNLLRLIPSILSIKHAGFYEENEARLISSLWKRNPFQLDNKEYIEYNFEPNIVKRVVIGPSNDQDKNINNIERFIKENKEYENVEIYVSKIPYIEKKE